MRALSTALVGLGAGAICHVAGYDRARDLSFTLATASALLPALFTSIRGLARGETGGDVIAVLAMAGALALDERLAACILAVMLSGGQALEAHALARANRELTALLARAPRTAQVKRGGMLVQVGVDEVQPGDLVVVRPGEVVPTDAVLVSDTAELDRSAITGESRPVRLERGAPVESGAVCLAAPVEVRATVPAARSTYAAIVRLVESAAGARAPLVRLADRYAARFLWLTLAIAGGAWAVSGEPARALAVLVVATPCPLLLAAPAAIACGVSRAARSGIVVKGGAALEALARVRIVLLDKTGTLTSGKPRVARVEAFGRWSEDEVVRFAAAADQISMHPYAPALTADARRRGLELPWPEEAREALGGGVEARVAGTRVRVGTLAWTAGGPGSDARPRALARQTAIEGTAAVFVSLDGEPAGALVLSDPIRPEAPATLRALRRAGVRRVDVVTGDRSDVAELVGDAVGADRVWADRTPEDKVQVVERVRAEGPTAMVGDGVNDAPALALADVGVAMGARGASAASEAADVVITNDRIGALALAFRIARRSHRLALESIFAGMGLCALAMLAAAAGRLTALEGAVLQELIDLAVLANALRALGDGGLEVAVPRAARGVGQRLERAHATLLPRVESISGLAARLDRLPPAEAVRELERLRDFLTQELLPHEREEQVTAYPMLGSLLDGQDPTGPLIHTHHEIARLVRIFGRLVEQLDPAHPDPGELTELRRFLFALHAILSLHFAQEDEVYLAFGHNAAPVMQT